MKPIDGSKIEPQNIFEFDNKQITYWQYIDSGIGLLKKFITYPETEIPDCLADVFPPFLEYVSFIEGIQRPFACNLKNCVSERIVELFEYLSKKEVTPYNSLTLYETFYFLRKIKSHSKKIFNIYGRLSTYASSKALYALETNDITTFTKAFDKEYCEDLMKTLWLLRFVLYGIVSDENITNDFADKHWVNDYDLFAPFFDWTNDEEKFIIENLRTFVCDRFIKSIIDFRLVTYEVTDNEQGRFTHYDMSLVNAINDYINNDVNPQTKIQKVLSSSNAIINECRENSEAVLFNAIYSHKSKLVGFTEEFFEALEKEWNDGNYGFIDINKSVVLQYIVLYLTKISFVYNLIEDFIYPKDREVLLNIIKRSNNYEKKIIGADCIFNIFSHKARNRFLDVTPQSIDASMPILGESNFIKNKCISYDKDGADVLYELTIHYLYLFLSGGEVHTINKENLEEFKDEKGLNNLAIRYPNKFIDCSENVFKCIMGVKTNINGNDALIMNWIDGKKQDMAAFLLVYCGIITAKGESAKNIGQLATRKEINNCCYRYKKEPIYIKGKEREAKPYYKYWDFIINKCLSAAIKDFKCNKKDV